MNQQLNIDAVVLLVILVFLAVLSTHRIFYLDVVYLCIFFGGVVFSFPGQSSVCWPSSFSPGNFLFGLVFRFYPNCFISLFLRPLQVILSMDEAAYVSELYGPGGPKIDPAFAIENEEDADEAVDNDADGEMGTESGTISGLSDHGEESDSW